MLAAIEELGYRRNNAARMLATNRSGRIGMISAHLALYGPSMIAVAVQEAGHAGRLRRVPGRPVRSSPPSELRGAVDRLLDEAVEALVVAVAHRDALDLAARSTCRIPVVVVQGVTAGQAMAAGIDQEAGGVLATEHLLGLGHRHVAHVTGPLDWVEAGQRRDGWLRAHERAACVPARSCSATGRLQRLRRRSQIADDPEVTAVSRPTTLWRSASCMRFTSAAARCPGDVSVVGFDDVPEAAYFWPALTTVTQAFTLLGRRAVELTLRALAGEAGPARRAGAARAGRAGLDARPARLC